jgi:uncharacterized protein YegP (UPF0339 family)
MTNKPDFYIDANGEHRWRIKAANNRTIADSGEGYHNKHDAAEGLYSALTNTELREVRKLAKKAPVDKVP